MQEGHVQMHLALRRASDTQQVQDLSSTNVRQHPSNYFQCDLHVVKTMPS